MEDKTIRLLIWGSGGYFRRLIRYYRKREQNKEIRIVGIVDKNRSGSKKLEGYPYIPPEAVPDQDFDYLQILTRNSRPAIREEYLKMPGSDGKKLIGNLYPEISIPQFLHLAESRPTIFSNICWGGYVYHFLGLECLSPFKNLWLHGPDFLSFLHDPRGYMAEEPVPDHMQHAVSHWDKDPYPVLRLGDIRLYCNHSESMEQAIADWLRRREKINWDFTVAMMAASDNALEREFSRLDTVHRELCLVPYQTAEPCSFSVSQKADLGYVELTNTINDTAYPLQNPFDMYSVFFGERKENPCYEPSDSFKTKARKSLFRIQDLISRRI